MSDELRDLTMGELIERNVALGREVDRIRDARRLIQAEVDRRAALDRDARAIAGLSDELQGRALAAADPELIERVGALRDWPPAQTVAPAGIESAEQVGEPGRRRGLFRRG